MTFQLVTTDDGSLSCVDSQTGELSHNRVGAYTESVQLYAQVSGLLDLAFTQGEIRVLDACYGMGYNSWSLINELVRLGDQPEIAAIYRERHGDRPIRVSLVCIEKYPEVLEFLPQVLGSPTFDPLKAKLTAAEHNTYYRTLQCLLDTKLDGLEPRKIIMDVAPFWQFELDLWVDDLRNRMPKLQGDFDAVFHDAYSPQKMPELWTFDLFVHYHRLLNARQGRVLTYSAAAAVRGGLQEAGFSIAKTPELGTKSGGTIARVSKLGDGSNSVDIKSDEAFADWELAYLKTKAGLPYRDPGLRQTRDNILASRQREQEASHRPSGSSALKKKPRYQPKI